jgi:hypothetical protein
LQGGQNFGANIAFLWLIADWVMPGLFIETKRVISTPFEENYCYLNRLCVIHSSNTVVILFQLFNLYF